MIKSVFLCRGYRLFSLFAGNFKSTKNETHFLQVSGTEFKYKNVRYHINKEASERYESTGDC